MTPHGMLHSGNGGGGWLRRHLPLARDLVRVARQQLVGRLDGYMSKRNAPIFRTVLQIIDDKARHEPDVLDQIL